ncbi:hypothetical protein NX786_17665 [Telluria mixta]|uniref:MFS transporter n=1 Tax=Telluria mixta TaxID=34071 RepID=A0ABT2C1B7_9BURK|nr:hypothetical protein [Telluria mixta]MCS0631164.1 hypothetical protein [Telluria mixta]WEM95702.1 hypothetical protein P0M04_30245 [Telluria mixta]
MNLDLTHTTSSDPVPADDGAETNADRPDLRAFVFALFFVFGDSAPGSA